MGWNTPSKGYDAPPMLPLGDWIRIDLEWRLLDGSKQQPLPRIEGQCHEYGCDSGRRSRWLTMTLVREEQAVEEQP